eukprot:m.139770 g.139770  ORF g.139770 m.139770 type:complete len:469 (-) comp10000_c0_seq1:53-1459(-)
MGVTLLIVQTAAVAAAALLLLLFVLLVIVRLWRRGEASAGAAVVVLGDIGHSPRMQYHVLSLADTFPHVDIVANAGSRPREAILANESIAMHALPKFDSANTRGPWYKLYKPLAQTLVLVKILLFDITRPSHILVQNPPAIPALGVVWFAARALGAKFVIDWHNYGYTILELGKPHPLVLTFASLIERVFGRWGDIHICVTKAMSEDLEENWGIRGAIPLYDRPPKDFCRLSPEDAHNLFVRLAQADPEMMAPFAFQGALGKNETVLTRRVDGRYEFRQDRPALVVSSTSWTPDEDFGILLEALQAYDVASQASPELPCVLCIITGKGPQKEMYMRKISESNLQRVRIHSAWLEAADYPRLLGSADVGVCLHTSSSKLDLPMKIVDMFGCQLPVIAYNYPTLGELVQSNQNGFLFTDSDGLSRHLQHALLQNGARLEPLRKNLSAFRELDWETNWNKVFRPALTGASS